MIINNLLYFSNLQMVSVSDENEAEWMGQVHRVLSCPVAGERMAAAKSLTKQFPDVFGSTYLFYSQVNALCHPFAVSAFCNWYAGTHQFQLAGTVFNLH